MTGVSPINQIKVALFATALYLLSGNGAAAGNKKYISKAMVDTLIQNAFVHLNASSDNMPGSDLRRKQAIADAKRVAARLRTIARGDPNEKYVLWKTGELSGQIYLEERDIAIKKLEKAQKEKNAIIAIFNAELGKKRPDFMILKKAGDDMMAWDPSKAREIQWSLDQRSLNISREVIYTLEKAFLTGNIEKIQNEFNYCKKNRLLLRISSQKYNRLDARIAALGEAIKLKPAVDEQILSADGLLPRNKLKEARKCLQEIQSLLSRIDRDLPPKEHDEYTAKTKEIASTINRKEDSLLAITYSILAAKGENAALDHIERVLKPCGVSEPKIGQVHTSIMNVATITSKSRDTTLNREMTELSQSDEQTGVDFALFRSAAKKKAQERADSARAAEEERVRRFFAEQARADSVRQATERKALQAFREHQEKANSVSVQIYTLLENNKIKEAYLKFASKKKSLEQFLYKDAFVLLQSTVTQAYETQAPEKGAPEGKGSLALIKQEPPPPATESARNSEEDLRRNQEKAQQVIAQIYGMLEAHQIEAAYQRFTQVRRPLKKYLCPEAFAMLETTVMQSYDSYLKSR